MAPPDFLSVQVLQQMVELRAQGFQQLVSEFVPPATVAAGVGQPCSQYIRTRNEQLAEREAKVGILDGMTAASKAL